MITVGSRVGGYTVIRVLGQGGMGQVFLAQHHRIARRVAVKVLLPELSSNESVIERFFTEARATSLIRHPGIVEVLDCDVLEGQAYIAMEYLEGESLAGYLARAGLFGDVGFALAVIGQVAVAVGAAHACDIIHRDLKPDNIFLCANTRDARVVPKVLDFGIAKVAAQGTAAQTRTGAVIGTPTYMSPEQCRGGSKTVDARSDVYSLGCILYETLCGRPPFIRDGMGDLIVAHVSEPPDDPRSVVPELPAALCALVMRMLAKNPDQRPPTMNDVAAEIAGCLASAGIRAPLSEITPRRPVIVPAVESLVPLATPAPSGGGSGGGLPATGPSSTPPPGARAGATRVLPRGTAASTPAERAQRATESSTLLGAAGERASRRDGPPARPSRAKWAVPTVAVVVLGGLGIVFALSRSKPPETTGGESTPPRPTIENTRENAAAAAPAVAAPAVAAAPAPEVVKVDVRGLPAEAELLLDGAPAAGPPLKLRRDDRRHLIVVRAKGYYDRTIEVAADRDQSVEAAMIATTSASTSAASTADKARAHESSRRTSHRQPSPGAPAAATPTAARETDGATPPKAPPSSGQKKSNYDDM